MTMPTKKNPAIEKMVDLLLPEGSLGRTSSIKSNICVWCSKPAQWFRDELSKTEYRISGMCQACQDKTFGVTEPICDQRGVDCVDELKVASGLALCPTCYAQEKHEYESD